MVVVVVENSFRRCDSKKEGQLLCIQLVVLLFKVLVLCFSVYVMAGVSEK